MDDKAYYTILGAMIAGLTACAIKILDVMRWSLENKVRREDELAKRIHEIYLNCVYYCSSPPFANPTTLAFGGSKDAPIEMKTEYWTKHSEFEAQRIKWLSVLAAYHPRPQTSESKEFQRKIMDDSMKTNDIITLMASDKRLCPAETYFSSTQV
jgi:hypothetical protein